MNPYLPFTHLLENDLASFFLRSAALTVGFSPFEWLFILTPELEGKPAEITGASARRKSLCSPRESRPDAREPVPTRGAATDPETRNSCSAREAEIARRRARLP